MKKKVLFFLIVCCSAGFAQELPDLPVPMGAGTAEVYNDQIYFFGGSNNWSGTVLYPYVYRFDGFSWTLIDTIPDNNVWDLESVRVGTDVYLLNGWPSSSGAIRKYNLLTGSFTYLTSGPISQTWGVTSEYSGGNIYIFSSDGKTHEYYIANDSWTEKTPNIKTGTWDLSSIKYQDEFYIIGYDDSTFFRYNPANDTWTQLAGSPYQVGACAFGIINNLIYCIGGNLSGSTGATYRSILVYDVTQNSWSLDSLKLSSKRHWMATAEYLGGLYTVGGIDSVSQAVATVEEIVPQGVSAVDGDESVIPREFSLEQNYPNPFNPRTGIVYTLPDAATVSLEVFNSLGQKVRVLAEGFQSAGRHRVSFDGASLSSGVYLYRLRAGDRIAERKMLLIK